MDRDQETEHARKRPKVEQPGRSWTERFTGPIRYRRYTDLDGGGRPSIFFKFELAPGQSDLPQEVYDILHQLKHLDRNPKHGKGSGLRPTHLEFQRSKKHGRVWKLPDDSTGRTAADIIDAKLSDLAEKLDREQGMGR